MRLLPIFTLLAIVFSHSHAIAFDVPDYVYELKDWRDASRQARDKKQPLVFILANRQGEASRHIVEESFKILEPQAQIVWVDSTIRGRFDKMPDGAAELRPRGMMTVPWAAVASADGRKGIKLIQNPEFRSSLPKAMEQVRKTIENNPRLVGAKDASELQPVPGKLTSQKPEKPTSNTVLLAPTQSWYNASGIKIEAAIEKIDGTQVIFIFPDGRRAPYPLDQLAQGSRQKIDQLTKQQN